MSGFQTDLLTGLASYLSLAGVGITWSPLGAYRPLQTGVVLGNVPQTPDRIITLTAYGISDSPNLSTSVIGVQVRCRWEGEDKRPSDDLTDAIFNLLHGMTNTTLQTGVQIVQCLRISGPASLGQDDNRRWANSSNYAVTVSRPSANRT